MKLKMPHEYNDGKGNVTISMGIRIINSDEAVSLDEAYQQADKAMYQAKHNGRNQSVVWDKK